MTVRESVTSNRRGAEESEPLPAEAHAPQVPAMLATPADIRRLQPLIGNHAVTAMVSRARLQRSPMTEARAAVSADREYRDKTAELEGKLGPHLSKRPEVHAIADEMLGRLKKVVDAWADATKQAKTVVYGTEFSFPGAQNYYGSFATTGENIKKILDDIKSQPLRTKLNTVYYSLRGNAFAKFLEAAALELQGGGKAITIDEKEAGKSRTVEPGFAQASGLKDVWDRPASPAVPGQMTPAEIADVAKKRTPTGSTPVLGVKSDAMNSQDPVVKSRSDKVYDKAVGLEWEDQPTLKHADVPDVTVDELKLLHQLEGGDPSKITDTEWLAKQKDWATKGTEQVRWEMGMASIDVKPGSDTRVIAEKFRARLDAGISGSTDLMMHAGVHLGLTSKTQMEQLRLALVAWMLSNRDHSFYEIMLAAEGYGVPFHRDAAKPGWEYETELNFAPLGAPDVAAFKTLMPDGKLPSAYLTPTHLKDVETSLPKPTGPEPKAEDALKIVGIDVADVLTATPEMFLANHEALTKAVADAAFQQGSGDEHELRRNRVRMQSLREHPSFHWLALHHAKKAVFAEAELEKLVNAKYKDALVTSKTLKDGKIPDALADDASSIKRLDLQRLVLVVKTAKAPTTKAELMTQLPYLAVKRHYGMKPEDAEKVLTDLLVAHKSTVIV